MQINCSSNSEKEIESKDEDLYRAALDMADLSCKSKNVSGKELEEINKKGEELGEKVDKLLKSKEDSTKFLKFLFDSQKKICPELWDNPNK